ncbi:hypothetical protein ACQ4LE_005562 [Meloidogyne hapla]
MSVYLLIPTLVALPVAEAFVVVMGCDGPTQQQMPPPPEEPRALGSKDKQTSEKQSSTGGSIHPTNFSESAASVAPFGFAKQH